MAYLSAALIMVGLLTAGNLLVTIGVIRRSREHTAQIATLGARDADGIALPVGSRVDDFRTESIDGRTIDLTALGDRAIVGFFSPHCPACHERLPAFKSYLDSHKNDRSRVLAVVAGRDNDATRLAEELRTLGPVVIEVEGGPTQRAFGVTGYPAFLLVENGLVTASSYLLDPVVGPNNGASRTAN